MDKDGMPLKEFIEKNHILLSAVAVFATITALLSNLPIKWVSTVLSFISIAGTVVIWHEVQTQLPKKMSPKLFLFRYVLLWGLGGLVFYWLLEFREIWHVFLFIPLTIVFMSEIVLTLRPLTELNIVKKIFGLGKEKNWFQKILKVGVALSIAFISLFLATLFSPSINLILDWIKNTFH